MGKAAVAGALATSLLVIPVSAGAVNGVKSYAYSTQTKTETSKSRSGEVNGVRKAGGVSQRGMGTEKRSYGAKSDLRIISAVNGV